MRTSKAWSQSRLLKSPDFSHLFKTITSVCACLLTASCCVRAGLVQEPAREVAEARAPPHQRELGLQQGRLRAPVQRADAAVPRGEPGRLRLLHLQQLGRQGALTLPR